jgi:hypothetical protein
VNRLDYILWRAMLDRFHKLLPKPINNDKRFEDRIGLKIYQETNQKGFGFASVHIDN